MYYELFLQTVGDLEFGLSDGLNLIALVEVLAGKKFKHVNRRPNFRSQKLENVTNTLRFLEDEEGIRIVNIGLFGKPLSHPCLPMQSPL